MINKTNLVQTWLSKIEQHSLLPLRRPPYMADDFWSLWAKVYVPCRNTLTMI